MDTAVRFGERRIYYNNFAAHLLNAYNPNMLYPDLPYRWSDADWRGLIDMVAGFGFNAFEFWLVPRLFCREGLASGFGREFIRQMTAVIDHAHTRNVKVILLSGLATVGADWRTYCPNVPQEWEELRWLWDTWTRTLPRLDGVSIFPGDPGACSRNGCTAETYIDKSVEIARLVRSNLPEAELEFGTWGPPFFGWGIIEGPENWQGEFLPEYQGTAWRFDADRARRSMEYLLGKLSQFPDKTSVAINLGFNPDGEPAGEASAIEWAREIAKQRPIQTWDFSLTEGENAIVPHYRFARLFERRRQERAAAPYRGGICFTMTPLLNQLSLYESAQSFLDPDAEPDRLAQTFYERLFGPAGKDVVQYLPLFEVLRDWGNYTRIDLSRGAYHQQMTAFAECLRGLEGEAREDVPFHPGVDTYRLELLFFAELFAALSGPAPDYDGLRRHYWERVYRIYDSLPQHVDPRPHGATDALIRHFANWAAS
ncbi:MAG TPA: hypothetical protein PK166_06170 [Candidatus Hydrogenedentes bacterium]|nr:hypothetical protein [Candidatus Hydrogenedentota bacterium]HQE75637.1 hypothetical protein [Candidatus Hydrogenedentota bacterium]HQH67966.1 hypothetical protein [Candidatus Hydrogenedentota bacterium]